METQIQEPISTRDLLENNADQNQRNFVRPNAEDSKSVPLFVADEAQSLRTRWEKIQIGFVDEPRTSVQQADELVATVIQRLAQIFADERDKLERDWGHGDSASTEDLRMALRRYRSLFDRLLSV